MAREGLIPLGARRRNQLEARLLAQREASDPGRRAFAERALRRLYLSR